MNFLTYIKVSYRKIQIIPAIGILLLALVSCTDDIELRSSASEQEGSITICIPDVDGAAQFGATRNDEFRNTRAVEEAVEGTISTLWLLAFPDENDTKGAETKITALTGYSNLNITEKNGGGYKEYTVSNFHAGDYHIYVLANLDRYIDKKISESTTEQDVKDMILKFGTNKTLLQNQLPMYCLNTEIKRSETGEPVSNGIFTIEGNANTIYADLKFLCSKVRFTVLFDHSENGFSNQYPSVNVNLTEATANNLVPEVAMSEGNVSNTAKWNYSQSLNPVKYPAEGSVYFDITKSNKDNCPANLDKVSPYTDQEQRAWQGVFYIPENPSTTENEQSYISVKGTDGSQNLEFSFKKRPFVRSEMYDLVAKMKQNDIELNSKILDWTPQELAYSLHGPYELIVEETKIPVSGLYTAMGYKTEASLSFDFPTVNYRSTVTGQMYYDIPFYVAEFIEPGTLDEEGNPYNLNYDFDQFFRIRINPQVPFTVLYDLEHYNSYDNEETVYTKDSLSYFHVVAGNLHKKIETEISALAYLIVRPQLITIDTRQYYLNGNEKDTYEIIFQTNYDNSISAVDFYFTDPDGLVKGVGVDDDMKLELCEGIDSENVYQNRYSIATTSGTLKLNIKNMLDGHTFWKENQEFTLTFTLVINNPHTGEEDRRLTETVTIIVKPFTTDYTIHFKDNSGYNWGTPHIFVYQDLLLPANLSGGYNNEGDWVDGSKYAGMVVGYVEKDQNDKSQKAYNAATQYVFSNNISFRGWYGFGGPEINNPYDIYEDYYTGEKATKYNRMGFVMLGIPKDVDGSTDLWTWNKDYGYTSRNEKYRKDRYRFDVNFNQAHADNVNSSSSKWVCSDCQSNSDGYKFSGANQDYDYPGIQMEKDDKHPGWWTYTLTGVASPGKTMIIFTETHAPWSYREGDWNSESSRLRYPEDYATGLPLFDFEDNEGWFIFNGENTYSERTQHRFFDEKEEALKAYNLTN